MTDAPAVALDLQRPFRRSTAIAAGVDPAALRTKRFRQIVHGVYISAAVKPHPLHDVQAALLVHPPTAFASHSSAAVVYGLPVPRSSTLHVSVLHAADRRQRARISPHVASPDAEVRTVSHLRVSAPSRMFLELAEELTLVDLVVVGDALVRRRLVTIEVLRGAASGAGSGPVGKLARRAASLVREYVDSPMESRLRMLLVLAGLPEPTVDHRIFDAAGILLYRFDLSYPELKILVEYDGRQHRDDLARWDHDTDRKAWFDDFGWRHVPVFSWGIYKRPDLTVDRVVKALRSRGCPDLPHRLSEEWRAYFPVIK